MSGKSNINLMCLDFSTKSSFQKSQARSHDEAKNHDRPIRRTSGPAQFCPEPTCPLPREPTPGLRQADRAAQARALHRSRARPFAPEPLGLISVIGSSGDHRTPLPGDGSVTKPAPEGENPLKYSIWNPPRGRPTYGQPLQELRPTLLVLDRGDEVQNTAPLSGVNNRCDISAKEKWANVVKLIDVVGYFTREPSFRVIIGVVVHDGCQISKILLATPGSAR